jgi:HlyD family secretion protein
VQVDLQEANVARQQGEIANQEVQLEDAQKQLERTQMMFDKGLANQQQLDQAILTVKTRTTSLDSARKQLLTTQANLNQAELNLSYTKVYAPIDGVIVNRLVDKGQFVQSSMTSPQFFRIATDLRQLKLSAGVDEAEIGKIRRGQRVNFTVDTYPNSTFQGTVEQVRLNATTQQNVVTYPVWINVQNPDLRLRPYLTANVDIVVQTAPNVLRVPNQATRFRPTSDMYRALGLEPPAPGGRAAAAGANGREAGSGPAGEAGAGRAGDGAAAAGQGRGGEGARVARGEPGAGQGANAQGAPGRQGGRQGGRGFGANLSPEERERALQQFAAGRGGRGGRGRNGGAPANQNVAPVELDAEKIDDLYAPMQVRTQGVTVYQWNPDAKQLTEKRIQIGITDGTFSQVVGGDLKVGDQLVTNIIVPVTDAQRQQQQQNIFNQGGGRGGFGGFGGDRGGGGGGGGGRGGGGRGGN